MIAILSYFQSIISVFTYIRLFISIIISVIIVNIVPHICSIAITIILHLGSLQLTFSRVLFSSCELVFAAFCSRPRMPVMNESWRISRMAGGKKRYPSPCRNYSKTMTLQGWGGWAERRNDNTSGRGCMEAEENGRSVCQRRRHFVWLIEAAVAQADDR